MLGTAFICKTTRSRPPNDWGSPSTVTFANFVKNSGFFGIFGKDICYFRNTMRILLALFVALHVCRRCAARSVEHHQDGVPHSVSKRQTPMAHAILTDLHGILGRVLTEVEAAQRQVAAHVAASREVDLLVHNLRASLAAPVGPVVDPSPATVVERVNGEIGPGRFMSRVALASASAGATSFAQPPVATTAVVTSQTGPDNLVTTVIQTPERRAVYVQDALTGRVLKEEVALVKGGRVITDARETDVDVRRENGEVITDITQLDNKGGQVIRDVGRDGRGEIISDVRQRRSPDIATRILEGVSATLRRLQIVPSDEIEALSRTATDAVTALVHRARQDLAPIEDSLATAVDFTNLPASMGGGLQATAQAAQAEVKAVLDRGQDVVTEFVTDNKAVKVKVLPDGSVQTLSVVSFAG